MTFPIDLDVLIIGGGPSGVISLRNILVDRRLKSVLCVERNEKPGGLWFDHTPRYSSLQILSQDWKTHGVEVDSAQPDRRASAESIAKWVLDYVDRWQLSSYISCSTEVASVTPLENGEWKVKLRDIRSNITADIKAKAVLVCTGVENLPKMPIIPGMETARMPIKHNIEIRDGKMLPEDEVIVLGAGPSSMDILQEACRRGCRKVYAVQRKAHLGLPDSFGIPEIKMLRLLTDTLRLPNVMVMLIVNFLSWLWTWWNRVPAWAPVDVDVTKDIAYAFRSELVPHVHSGRLETIQAHIKEINGDQVVLSNGRVLQPEMVVCATGWTLDLKFLPSHQGMTTSDLTDRLYCRFLDTKYKNLFFVSVANGFMAATRSADIVSRCIIQILTGDWSPRSNAAMVQNIENVVKKGVALPGKFERELEREGFNMEVY